MNITQKTTAQLVSEYLSNGGKITKSEIQKPKPKIEPFMNEYKSR